MVVAKPAAPAPVRYEPITLPVILAQVGNRYVDHNERGARRVGRIVSLAPCTLARYDRTHVMFGVEFKDPAKPETFRHERVGTFESEVAV